MDDLIYLFYPSPCVVCNRYLVNKNALICFKCASNLPVFRWNEYKVNPVEKLFYGRIKIHAAAAQLIFKKKSSTQKILHLLKYKGRQDIGAFLGRNLADEMLRSEKFSNADLVIPVPVHPEKMKIRGYNQVTTFGRQISSHLGIPYREKYLKRKNAQESQTTKSRYERNRNVSEAFCLNDHNQLINKHIILVDDIITSGATLEACARLFLAVKGTRVSLASMAFTE